MSILGIDTGMATCGWARYDLARRAISDLGVVITEQSDAIKVRKTVDRVRRIEIVSRVLVERARGCSLIVVEQLSFPPGGVKAAVPIALSWGMILGIVAAMFPRPRLLTISPQKWQRAVLPDSGTKVDYPRLERTVSNYLAASGHEPWLALQSLPKGQRNHAIDACALALVGAEQPGLCFEVAR